MLREQEYTFFYRFGIATQHIALIFSATHIDYSSTPFHVLSLRCLVSSMLGLFAVSSMLSLSVSYGVFLHTSVRKTP